MCPQKDLYGVLLFQDSASTQDDYEGEEELPEDEHSDVDLDNDKDEDDEDKQSDSEIL